MLFKLRHLSKILKKKSINEKMVRKLGYKKQLPIKMILIMFILKIHECIHVYICMRILVVQKQFAFLNILRHSLYH